MAGDSPAAKTENFAEKEERLREKLKRKTEDRKRADASSSNQGEKPPHRSQEASSSKEKNNGKSDDRESPHKSRSRRRGRDRSRDRRQDSRGRSGPPQYYPPVDNRGYHGPDPYGRERRYDYRDAPYPPARRGRGYDRGGGYYDRDRYPRGGGGYRNDRDFDRFRRDRRDRSLSRSRSRSRSRSYSYSSRSRSSSRSYSRGRSRSVSSDRSRSRSRSLSRSVSRSHSRSHSRSKRSSRSRRSPSSSIEPERDARQIEEDSLTKEHRTLLVSQLVMKATERDITRYFKRQLGLKVREVIMLRDKRTQRNKGCAYVELVKLEDVNKAIEESGKVPDFQRFPILIKASESNTISPVGVIGGKMEAQKVYIGNIDQGVTQSQLYAIFSQFGELERVMLQVDVATGLSKGFAFLTYKDPKVSNLAMVTMSGQIFASKAIKTGWANQNTTAAGIKEVQSSEFPEDAVERVEKANVVFKQLNGTGLCQTPGILLIPGMASRVLAHQALSADATQAQIVAIAEEAVNLALGLPPSPTPSATPLPTSLSPIDEDNPKHVRGNLSRHILVRNMFNKDEETDEGWAEDIKEEFKEEGGKHGKIEMVKVMSEEPGGKIYASFDNIEGAAACAENFAGRFFDKRQLRVEFVKESTIRALLL